MTIKMLLFASLLAVAAMATSAAQSPTDVRPDTTLGTSEDETKREKTTKPGARHDHAAERLGATAPLPRSRLPDKSSSRKSPVSVGTITCVT